MSSKRFHILAKPAGADCNLDCSYCFYLSRSSLHDSKNPRMSERVLLEYVSQYLASQPDGRVELAFQGGEPTLMGVEFYEKVSELAAEHARPEQQVVFAIQTNGLLLDQAWLDLFKRDGYLVGLSIDGPEHLHDRYRVGKEGAPSHSLVIEAAKKLTAAGVEWNALVTVNAATASDPLAVYRHLRDEAGATFLQFIPVVQREGNGVSADSVQADDYGDFLNAIFDEWLQNDFGTVSVRMFEDSLGTMLGERAGHCINRETCGTDLVLEANGDLYSCDHFVTGKHRLGNILEQPLAEIATCTQQVDFGMHKFDKLPEVCKGCKVRGACQGGCPKNWFGDQGQNFLCSGLLSFYMHAAPYLHKLAERIKQAEAGEVPA